MKRKFNKGDILIPKLKTLKQFPYLRGKMATVEAQPRQNKVVKVLIDGYKFPDYWHVNFWSKK